MWKSIPLLHSHLMYSYLLLFFLISFDLLGDHEMVMAQNTSARADQFKVGVVLDLDKVETKMWLNSISMALSDFYASNNTSHKRRLVPYIRDSNNDVVGAASAAIDLMRNVKVQAIIGPPTSSQAIFMADLGNKALVPIISFTATSPSISPSQNPYFVRMTQVDSSQVNAIAAIVKSFGWREAITIYEDTEYGNGIIPYMIDALQDINARVPYRSVIPLSATDDRIVLELYKLMTMQTRVFIVHMTQRLGLKVLQKAKEIGLMSEGCTWIITDGLGHHLDSFNSSVLDSMQGVLVVRPYIPMSNELERFKVRWRNRFLRENKDSENPELDSFGIWAYDTIWALASSVEKLERMNSHFLKPKVVKSSSDIEKLGVSEIGSKLLEEISNVKFRGLSGEVSIVDRQLQSTAFKILNVDEHSAREIGIWTPDNGFTQDLNLVGTSTSTTYSSNKDNLRPIKWPGNSTIVPKGWVIPTYEKKKKLRIGVPNLYGIFTKFVNISKNEQTNSTMVTGFCIDVFEAAIKELPYAVPYEFIPFQKDDGTSAGSYNELVEQVYNQNYDAVVGDVTITADRSLHVDFTLPYLQSGLSMIAPVKVAPRKDALIFLKPLKMELWITSAAFFVLTGVVIWFLEHRINDQFRGPREHQLGTMFSFSFSTLVFAQKERVLSNLARFVLIVWVFIVLVLTSAYTASLASMLTVGRLEPIVTDNMQKLIKNRVNVGCKRSSYVFDMLKEEGFYESNLIEYKSTPEDFIEAFSKVREYDEAFKNDNGIVAVFDELPYNKLLVSEHCEKYTIVKSPAMKLSGFGFVFPKGSLLGQDVSWAILKLIEDDKMSGIEKYWFGNSKACPEPNTNVPFSNRLSLDSFWVLFIVAGLSLILAVLIFSINFLSRNRDLLKRDDPAYTSIWERILALGRRFNEKDLTFHTYKSDVGNRSMELV